MASNWEVVKLENAAQFFSGGTPPKSKPEYWGGDIPWISAKSMKGSRYHDSDLKLTEAGLKKGSRLASKNSILLLVRGSMLHQKIPVGIATKDVAFNQDVKAIVPNEKFLPLYFYYCFAGREHELLAKVENTGIGAGKLDTDVLNKVEFYCPPIQEQKVIANFLGSLDDKIELNRQMNETLEAMAQALFKSWFVDFDPVIDNALAAGNAIPDEFAERAEQRKTIKKKDNSDIQKLFPDAFEFTEEMGWVPKGWSIQSFSELAILDTTSVKPNSKPEKIWEHFSIPAFDVDMSPVFDTGEDIKSNKYKVNANAVLVSKLNPETERIWWVNIQDEASAICSTEFMQFIPVNSKHRAFIYSLVRSAYFQTEILSRVTGSTGSRQRAQPKSVAVIDVLKPNEELVSKFSEIVLDWKMRGSENIRQDTILAKLRDTLLPKLMSGELRIPDAEALVDEAI
uniref:restriction endonuclease subunit S n=1 Tax=uncultured Psychrobacter sp. TaxID=259303 RepID=UPI00263918F9|nr:restriction endonuclease subunit S [uncultured Psychrobacter sp.]